MKIIKDTKIHVYPYESIESIEIPESKARKHLYKVKEYLDKQYPAGKSKINLKQIVLITFPFKNWYGPKPTILSPNSTNIIFCFLAGGGAGAYNICPGCEIFFDGSRVFKRVSFRDINSDSERQSGLRVMRDYKLCYYLIPTLIPIKDAQQIIDENKIGMIT